MALEAGGYAEKLGNRYEANWIAYQLIRLLEEKITRVTIEPIGDDEIGVDLIIDALQGQTEYHQCKASSGNNEYWTLSKLNQSKILKNALFQIERGATEFHLVSPLSCKKITDLGDSAFSSNGNPNDFMTYQIEVSQERQKDFSTICRYLGLDISITSDIMRAIDFLTKFKVIQYITDSYTQKVLEDKASELFFDKPINLLNFLKNYPVDFNKLRSPITSLQLLKDLTNSGFQQKIVPDDNRILPVIDNLSSEFEESIRPFLISSALIPRGELEFIVNSLENNAVTLIKAESGRGKSALLLELHHYLKANNIISVPIRLDRRRPEHNPDEFGRTLGFPYSPIHSVTKFAPQQKIVFILDQLDAIRWTASHSNNALTICQALVRQVISLRKEGKNISIIFASRDFDLNEDIALSNWLDSIRDNLFEIQLNALDESTVISLVEPYEAYSYLSEGKKEILKIPLWLSIYLSIAQQTKKAPEFNNKIELVKKFWEDRLNQIPYEITNQEVTALVDKIVNLMISRSCLSISDNLLPTGTKKQLEALISIGLLSKQNQRISFRHQALFDYQIGKKLFNAGIESPQRLLNEIGSFETQSLTKRERTKYALNMLLDYDQGTFCRCVEAILFNNNIRFHLKHLVLNSIKEIKKLQKPAKLLIESIIADSLLFRNFLTISCYSNVVILHYLSEKQHISRWLQGKDDSLINITINLLRSIAASEPDLIIKELSVFIGRSEQWNQRIYSALPLKIENDTDDIFDLRKKLLKLGCIDSYLNWKSLSKNKPLRALSLIELILEHYRDVICEPAYSTNIKTVKQITQCDYWSDYDFNEIKELATTIPIEIIKVLLKYIDSIFNLEQNEYYTNQWFYQPSHINQHDISNIRSRLLILIEIAGKQLGTSSDKLLELISPYLEKSNVVITHLVATLLLNLSNKHADRVVNWLITCPKTRLACGNQYIEPVWILPSKLVNKFSAYCSEDVFVKLEKTIYFFPSSESIERIKKLLEYRKNGIYESYWGELQYFLLPKLDLERISCESKQLVPALKRKFSTYTEADFCLVNNYTGGVAVSPLSKNNNLSNKAWRKLILIPDAKFLSHKFTQISDDVASMLSIGKFANSLQSSVINEPIRFARFALSLPKTINTKYIDAFFYGLAATDKRDVINDYKDQWKPCSIALIEQVIIYFNNKNCEYALVRLLESRADSWSKQIIDILINLAKYSKNPEVDSKKEKIIDCADAILLLNIKNASVRGIAYKGISKIFWNNKVFALENLELVDSAINDEHPAVKLAAISLLTPLLNYYNNYAHDKFIELCHKDLRMTCGYNASPFFNQGFESEHRSQYIDLTRAMLASNYDEVRKEAAKQIYACWFLSDLFKDQISIVLQGDNVLKKGVSSVVCQFIRENKYHDKIDKIEYAYQLLINDDNNEILREVGECVADENYWLKSNTNNLFNLFITSKAAARCLSSLFKSLEKHSKNLLDFSEPIFKLIETITNNENMNEKALRINFQESSLLAVLQKLYDEATDDMDNKIINRCLDIWDRLLQSGMYSAVTAINKLENSLLD